MSAPSARIRIPKVPDRKNPISIQKLQKLFVDLCFVHGLWPNQSQTNPEENMAADFSFDLNLIGDSNSTNKADHQVNLDGAIHRLKGSIKGEEKSSKAARDFATALTLLEAEFYLDDEKIDVLSAATASKPESISEGRYLVRVEMIDLKHKRVIFRDTNNKQHVAYIPISFLQSDTALQDANLQFLSVELSKTEVNGKMRTMLTEEDAISVLSLLGEIGSHY